MIAKMINLNSPKTRHNKGEKRKMNNKSRRKRERRRRIRTKAKRMNRVNN